MTVALSVLTNYGRSLYYLWGNRRSCERLPIEGPIRLGYYDGSGRSVTLACACVDVSANGMGVQSPEAIPVDTEVYLCAGKSREFRVARVCHCHERGPSFRIG